MRVACIPYICEYQIRIVDIYKRRQNKMERRVSLFMPVVSSDSRVPVTHKKGPLKIKNNAVLRARLYGRFLLVITRVLLSLGTMVVITRAQMESMSHYIWSGQHLMLLHELHAGNKISQGAFYTSSDHFLMMHL